MQERTPKEWCSELKMQLPMMLILLIMASTQLFPSEEVMVMEIEWLSDPHWKLASEWRVVQSLDGR